MVLKMWKVEDDFKSSGWKSVGIVILAILILVGLLAFFGGIVSWAWNNSFSVMFSLPRIGLAGGTAVIVLLSIVGGLLFKRGK